MCAVSVPFCSTWETAAYFSRYANAEAFAVGFYAQCVGSVGCVSGVDLNLPDTFC